MSSENQTLEKLGGKDGVITTDRSRVLCIDLNEKGDFGVIWLGEENIGVATIYTAVCTWCHERKLGDGEPICEFCLEDMRKQAREMAAAEK